MPHSRTPSSSVLLIDDDEDCRFVYALALEHAGFRVLLAAFGEEGVRLAAEHQPHVILLDLMLPDMPGEEVALAIRHEPSLAETPIVAITASVSLHERAQLLATGFADALLKPIYPAQVVKAVEARFIFSERE